MEMFFSRIHIETDSCGVLKLYQPLFCRGKIDAKILKVFGLGFASSSEKII
jgi:hypothetical protein